MVFEELIDTFFTFFEIFIPEFSYTLDIPPNTIENFGAIVQSVSYFLPLNVLFPLFVLSVSLDFMNIGWKILLRVKSFIPSMGA